MLTSSIDRRGSSSRSNGASATSSSPAACSSSSSARKRARRRPPPAARDPRAKNRKRRRRSPSPTTCPTRSIARGAARRRADDSQFAGGRRGTATARRDVGRHVERRARRSCACRGAAGAASSASAPMVMMSWEAARVLSSASVTGMPTHRSYQRACRVRKDRRTGERLGVEDGDGVADGRGRVADVANLDAEFARRSQSRSAAATVPPASTVGRPGDRHAVRRGVRRADASPMAIVDGRCRPTVSVTSTSPDCDTGKRVGVAARGPAPYR